MQVVRYVTHKDKGTRNGSDYAVTIEQGFPTWGKCTLGVHFPIWRGTLKVSNRSEKYLYYCSIYFQLFIQTSVNIIYNILKNHYLRLSESLKSKNINNSVEFCYVAKPFCHKKHAEMLKGYTVRERLGNPAIEQQTAVGNSIECGE